MWPVKKRALSEVFDGMISIIHKLSGEPATKSFALQARKSFELVHSNSFNSLSMAGISRCLLRRGTAEPLLETRRGEARVIAGCKAFIVQLCAEVPGVDVHCHLP